jgi:hypothetical protein
MNKPKEKSNGLQIDKIVNERIFRISQNIVANRWRIARIDSIKMFEKFDQNKGYLK